MRERHTHDLGDLSIDVAPAMHEHDERDLRGVAPKRHSHIAEDLSGTPTIEEFLLLQDQVATLTEQTRKLAAQLLAEREVGKAVADGNDTTERIAEAIDRRADSLLDREKHTYLGLTQSAYLAAEFQALAREIREGTAP